MRIYIVQSNKNRKKSLIRKERLEIIDAFYKFLKDSEEKIVFCETPNGSFVNKIWELSEMIKGMHCADAIILGPNYTEDNDANILESVADNYNLKKYYYSRTLGIVDTDEFGSAML